MPAKKVMLFTGANCKSCGPALEIFNLYKDRPNWRLEMDFERIDINNDVTALKATAMRVGGLPCMIFLVRGKEVKERITGDKGKAVFDAAMLEFKGMLIEQR